MAFYNRMAVYGGVIFCVARAVFVFSPAFAITEDSHGVDSFAFPSTVQDNKPPIAHAGQDQVVHPGDLVILSATGSKDPEGKSLTYLWKQLKGAKVLLTSDRIANPSFTAGSASESLVFLVTVQDEQGASTVDFTTVSVQANVSQALTVRATPLPTDLAHVPTNVQSDKVLQYALYGVTAVVSLVVCMFAFASGVERISYVVRSRGKSSGFVPEKNVPRGRVLHRRTGSPMGGVQIMIYDADGKLRSTEITNEQGEFPSLFPAGEYGLTVNAPELEIAPDLNFALEQKGVLVYTGGTFTVHNSSLPIDIIVPVKHFHQEISTKRMRLLELWQEVQFWNRTLSWYVWILGFVLTTALVFLYPSMWVYGVEVLYVLYAISKVLLGFRQAVAYGVVRDSVTHTPLDLVVIRLFDQATNRLLMTRITDAEGKFSVLPSAGTYRLTATHQGYEVFTRENIRKGSNDASALQISIDLVPLVNLS